jgi:predicted TIM-barrel fold metal-dependent hydrolase
VVDRLVSADSHMLVLDEHVLAHLSPEHHDAYLGQRGPHRRAGVTATAPPPAPPDDEQVGGAGRPGEFDPVERLADMDLDGVDAEVLYTDPTGGASFYKLDVDAGLACLRAFNTAALEFAATDPKRLLPVYLLPLHDVRHAIDELHRIVAEGGRAVQLPLYPGDAGLPLYWDERYEPLWAALAESGVPLSLHVCPPAGRSLGKDPTPARGVFQVMPPIMMAQPMVELIVTGTFARHPCLRVILVEAGLSWIPYMLDRLDRVSQKSKWTERGMQLADAPSTYWFTNMAATFEEDELGLEMRERIGVDNLLWATDYPHPDSTWPESRRVVAEQFTSCTDEEVRKLVCDNATRMYGL